MFMVHSVFVTPLDPQANREAHRGPLLVGIRTDQAAQRGSSQQGSAPRTPPLGTRTDQAGC